MKSERILTTAVFDKLSEQIALTTHLISLIPPDKLAWSPAQLSPSPVTLFRLDDLLGHLLDCLAGVCAVLHALHPNKMAHLDELRQQATNYRCEPEEARARIRAFASHIEEGFAVTADADLRRLVPTVFVPQGETALTLLLGNLEHIINHKHQLFFYLKLLGVPLGTSNLYHLRGDVSS
jgi:hypothetical protein